MPRETRSDTSPPAGLGDAAIGSGLSENGIFRKEGEYLDDWLRQQRISEPKCAAVECVAARQRQIIDRSPSANDPALMR